MSVVSNAKPPRTGNRRSRGSRSGFGGLLAACRQRSQQEKFLGAPLSRRLMIIHAQSRDDAPLRLAPAGAKFEGPAIVEERESTIIVGEDAEARVDEYGFVWINLN